LPTLTLGLSEPCTFTAGASHFISLLRDDGTVTSAIAVTPGPTAYDLVLAAAPDFTLVLDDATRERPKYVFGASGQHRVMVRVLGIRKQGRTKDGAPTIELTTVAEDVRVHTVDNALLPGPGEIQDSVTTSNDDGTDTGGGSLYLVDLLDNLVSSDTSSATDMACSFTLNNNGTCSYTSTAGNVIGTALTNQWMRFGVCETAVAALYEVRFTWLGTTGSAPTGYGTNYDQGTPTSPTGGTLDSWLNLGTSRSISLSWPAANLPTAAVSAVRVEIRVVGEVVNQASPTITLHCQTLNSGNAF
jgi:hypothetical protein